MTAARDRLEARLRRDAARLGATADPDLAERALAAVAADRVKPSPAPAPARVPWAAWAWGTAAAAVVLAIAVVAWPQPSATPSPTIAGTHVRPETPALQPARTRERSWSSFGSNALGFASRLLDAPPARRPTRMAPTAQATAPSLPSPLGDELRALRADAARGADLLLRALPSAMRPPA